MFVLTRRIHESIFIGPDIEIKLIEIRGRGARIGIEAPTGLKITRDARPPAAEPDPDWEKLDPEVKTLKF